MTLDSFLLGAVLVRTTVKLPFIWGAIMHIFIGVKLE